MIAEFGLGKLIATGGGLVCSVVVIAGLGGGAKYALTASDTTKLRSAICAYATSPDAVRQVPAHLGLSSQQVANARKIVNIAAELGLSKRAAEIALATAIQESSLTNLTSGNGSYGLFQQQPSQGWGTKQQVTDPSHAARSFYTRLIKFPAGRTCRSPGPQRSSSAPARTCATRTPNTNRAPKRSSPGCGRTKPPGERLWTQPRATTYESASKLRPASAFHVTQLWPASPPTSPANTQASNPAQTRSGNVPTPS